MTKTLIKEVDNWFKEADIAWHTHTLFILSVISTIVFIWWLTTKLNQRSMLKKHLQSANDQLWIGI